MKEIPKQSFNLIQKDVEVRQAVKTERDWYLLLNISVVCIFVVLGFLSYLIKANIKTNIDNKSTTLANTINGNLNVANKVLVKARIDELQAKFDIYKNILSQNFDTNDFYKEITSLHNGLQIDKFSVRPGSVYIDTSLRFEANGYKELDQIIAKLEQSKKYKLNRVKAVSFVVPSDLLVQSKDSTLVNKLNESQKFITLVTVEFVKITS